ncbi:MAG: HupE/UreJ family protein [Candidatus Eiseniibacteriota bacterium]
MSLAAFGFVPRALAHDAPYSYLRLNLANGRLSGSLTAHRFDLANELGLAAPESLASEERVDSLGPIVFPILAGRLRIVADGDTLALRLVGTAADDERSGATFDFESPTRGLPSRIEVGGRLFPYDPEHETYVNLYVGDSLRHQDLIDRAHPVLRIDTSGRPRIGEVVRRFTAAGIHHIFIGPDHILFVIGLLLLGGSIGKLLKIVTAFTVAHSITLAIASLGVWNPPARIVEPLIALSIVFVGCANLVALRRTGSRTGAADARVALAFGFGFVHGFGFANVLAEFGLPREALGWALFSFNFGVELGQAAIVLAAAPALALLRSSAPRLAGRVVQAGSVAVIAAGAWWFFERVRGS